MTRRLIWASAHESTAEQQAELVKEFGVDVQELKTLNQGLWERMSNIERGEELETAKDLVEYLMMEEEKEIILIQPAGNPKFQFELGGILIGAYSGLITVMYAYSERQSVDVVMEDGSVVKTSIFQHQGFE